MRFKTALTDKRRWFLAVFLAATLIAGILPQVVYADPETEQLAAEGSVGSAEADVLEGTIETDAELSDEATDLSDAEITSTVDTTTPIATAADLAPAAEYVCYLGNQGYTNFGDALGAVYDNSIIKLLTNINYNQSIVIDGKSLVFDLNGYVLNVSTTSGDALVVSNAGKVRTLDGVGTGAFNVTSTAASWHYLFAEAGRGVVARDGSIVSVTNASGTTCAIMAEGEGTRVTATGNATVPFANTTTITTGIYADSAVVNVDGNVSGTWYGIVCYNSYVTVGGDVSADIFYSLQALRNSVVVVQGNAIGTYFDSPQLHSGSQLTVEGVITYVGSQRIDGEYVPIEIYSGLSLNGETMHVGQAQPSLSKPGYAELTDGDCYLWVRQTPELELTQAKYAKVRSIRALRDSYIESYYTPESWQDMMITVNAAIDAVWQATSFQEVEAVPMPDVASILVPVQPVGTPGSGDPFGRGFTTMDIALMAARAAVGMESTLTEPQRAALDMDFDGYLTMTDVLLIMRKSCGLDN